MTNKNTIEQKPIRKVWGMINIKLWIYLTYLFFAYSVFYRTDNNGWFIKKRLWLFIILAPVLIPFFMIYGIVMYYEWITTYKMCWLGDEKRKLSFKEKIAIKYQLHS